MKKILTCLVLTLYFLSFNSCFAVSNLYFLKNTGKTTVKPIIEESFTDKKYNITKYDPYVGVLQKDSSRKAIIILQTSGNNMFYYYDCDSTALNKEILKQFKDKNIVFEQSYNENYLSTFETKAQKVANNITTTVYNFEQVDEEKEAQPINKKATTDNSVLKGGIVQISKGTSFKTFLQTPINTATANVNDEVIAILSEDWNYNGSLIAAQGSTLKGYLSKARHATYGSMNGRVIMQFTTLETPDGKTYNLSADDIDITVSNDGKLKKTVKNVAVSAATGAIVGLIVGAFTGDIGQAAAIGAGIGAGSAAVASGVEQGVDAEIPLYTELNIELKKPLNVVLNY